MSDEHSSDQKGRSSEIYFAGGCFWGLEKAFSEVKGVTDTECGYANGYPLLVPDYMLVCSGKFGYRETVKLTYDPTIITLDRLLEIFYFLIDPTLENRQGNDRGPQYQTGIYWTDEASGKIVKEYTEKEKTKYKEFHTETVPLSNFHTAEEYHQDYLVKNPDGYCHISPEDIEMVKMLSERKK